MRGARESVSDGRGVADFGVDHDIRDVVVEPRRAGFDRVLGLGHRRQRLVVYDDAFGGILRLGDRLGDHEGHGSADVAHAIDRQHGMRRHRHRRAVGVLQHDVRRRAGRREMRNDFRDRRRGRLRRSGPRARRAWCAPRRIDRADQGMRMRRAQRRAIGLAGKIKVVAVTATAGQEA